MAAETTMVRETVEADSDLIVPKKTPIRGELGIHRETVWGAAKKHQRKPEPTAPGTPAGSTKSK